MAEYMNPFAGSMLPESVPNNPFMSRDNQLSNREMMAPFMNMEMQRQQQALQKTGIENQEFTSPEAVDMRKTNRTSTTAKNKLEIAEADQKLGNMPMDQKLKIAEFKNKLSDLEGTPQRQMLSFLSGQAGVLEKAPAATRPMVYDNIIKQFKATHPNQPVPAEWETYNDQVGSQLSALRLADIMTPKHVQELDKERVRGEWGVRQHQATAGGTVAAAQIHEAGQDRRKRMEITEAAKQNPGQFRVAQRRILSNPNSTQEAREVAEEALTMSLSDDLPKLYQSDPRLNTLAVISSGNSPKALQAKQEYEARRSEIFENHLISNGVREKMERPDGKIVTLNKSEVPEALKRGYKKVK